MTDLYLRFPDEATANAALDGYEGSVDVIGVIYKPTGEMLLGEDGEYPAMAALPGWHVNTRGPATAELEQYAVEVATPTRVWA